MGDTDESDYENITARKYIQERRWEVREICDGTCPVGTEHRQKTNTICK